MSGASAFRFGLVLASTLLSGPAALAQAIPASPQAERTPDAGPGSARVLVQPGAGVRGPGVMPLLGGARLAASERHVYVLAGGRLYAFDAASLRMLASADLIEGPGAAVAGARGEFRGEGAPNTPRSGSGTPGAPASNERGPAAAPRTPGSATSPPARPGPFTGSSDFTRQSAGGPGSWLSVMGGLGDSAIVATDRAVYVMQGDRLLALEAGTLRRLGATSLPLGDATGADGVRIPAGGSRLDVPRSVPDRPDRPGGAPGGIDRTGGVDRRGAWTAAAAWTAPRHPAAPTESAKASTAPPAAAPVPARLIRTGAGTRGRFTARALPGPRCIAPNRCPEFEAPQAETSSSASSPPWTASTRIR